MIKILALFTFACSIFLSAWQSSRAQKVDQPLAQLVSVNGTTISSRLLLLVIGRYYFSFWRIRFVNRTRPVSCSCSQLNLQLPGTRVSSQQADSDT